MPKNMGKGGKSFKAGNSKSNQHNQKRELLTAEEGEEYAHVKKALGNLNMELQLAGGTTVIGHIRGAMVRKVYVTPGDVVLISKREFNANDPVDIIYRFTPAEVRTLVKTNVIPRDFSQAEKAEHADYEFVNDEDESGEEEDDQKNFNRDEIALIDPLAELEDL
ncbi:translation initiation factor 1A [Angomonas deanei]|uniref:Translation initiation factor 1A / IF-1, putative n=1 Tax=Angomonas deanei TaxID=59799 RepID=A0A7G2BZE1_9TRYP|nr:translation initiation factor 1A [Angomonas deanei]CAD2212655.1 Translation initiation factor 1A / IF-1, putative [Angomonas deanei]|eukprot:EPY41228.1 translation initiation factor 1A [Angomonas deanei]